MPRPRPRLLGILTALALSAVCRSANAQVLTQFTYQGVLKNNGVPVNSPTDLRFSLWTQAAGGVQVGANADVTNASVTSGLFSATIDFGPAPFAEGRPLYLQIDFRNPAGGIQPYTTMLQRQLIASAPFSIATRGLNVATDGKVGIGTSAPASALELGDTNLAGDRYLQISTAGGNAWRSGIKLRHFTDANGFSIVSDERSGGVTGLHFIDEGPPSPSTQMFIENDSGRVGIATTTPQAKLDVRFSASASNGIKVTDVVGGVNAIGVDANVNFGWGVRGEATTGAGTAFGVYGTVNPSNASGWGVYSNGRLGASGTKSFMIDHPLDPEGAMLLHYSCESPEPQNRYNGNAVLDGRGMATVQLPDYFSAINTDFRYQLTAIGAPGPSLYIAQEVVNNGFVIAGGQPGMKVSWEVTAKRSDRFVQQMGAPVEVRKAPEQQGKYLMPELYGQSQDKAMYPRPAITPEVAAKP